MKREIIYLFILGFLVSCAKPQIVDISKENDAQLNCGELDLEILEAKNFRNLALKEKDGTGGNLARMFLFWPSLAQTFHNSDKAISAADSRIYLLTLLQKKKKCKNINQIKYSNSAKEKTISAERYKMLCKYGVFNPPECKYKMVKKNYNLTKELKELDKLRKSGVITEDEFTKAKNKILK